MKKVLKVIFWAIIALCILVPLFKCDEIVNYSVSMTTMFSGLCGLATLYIAILLYDRFGVESKTKERTLLAIEETIAEMQKVHFILCHYAEEKGGEAPKDTIISLVFQGTKERAYDLFTEESLSSPLYYKSSGMYGCAQISQNIESKVFLPKTVAEAVDKLSIFTYEPQNIASGTRPITTLSASSEKINYLNDKLDGTDTNLPEQRLSVAQFIDAYFGVKEAIVKWYKDNGIDTTNLNL